MKDERTLNERIACDVMGWTQSEREVVRGSWRDAEGAFQGTANFWAPSANISQAWTVVEKMREKGFQIEIAGRDNAHMELGRAGWAVNIGGKWGNSDSFPEAVCLAALKAVSS